MKNMQYRVLKRGTGKKHGSPIHMAFIDNKDIANINISKEAAVKAVVEEINEPVAVNILDMNVLTTTSDGLVVEGAIINFAAGDKGKIHSEFGILPLKKIEVNEELFEREPHTELAQKLYEGRPIYRGADYDVKKVPIHNSVMTGKAINNNSGTEIMNSVTMEELLIPILGQIEIMKGNDVVLGITGEEISVGIGTTILEDYSRSQPFMKCSPGDTAHDSGKFAKNLKSELPILVAPKKVLANHIIQALEEGFRPGQELAASPAVLMVCHYMDISFNHNNITDAARAELEAIGIEVEKIGEESPKLSFEEVMDRASEIIPGVRNGEVIDSKEIIEKLEVNI